GLTALTAEFTVGEGKLMTHDEPCSMAPDDKHDLISGTCSHLPKDIMPVAFEFKCVPFEGLKERPFKLRLSIITGDRPVLVLRIIQLEAVQEDMANEFRDLLVEKFKDSNVETFIGTFTA
ncbi:DUF2303 family protein, partial [Escherichia coli]|uniref:DUF2303 family protein n=4 Tax=Escherichia coli TaxID=562 RepID=UPI001FCE99A9